MAGVYIRCCVDMTPLCVGPAVATVWALNTRLALVARLGVDLAPWTPLGYSHHFVTHHVSHTIFHTPSLTHHLSYNFVTHHLSHTTLSHPLFHTQLWHTHYLSHTTLSHTIFDTWSFTHHFVTHHLSHTIFDTPSYTQLCHTPSFTHHLSHTIFDTPSLTHHLSHHLATHHLSHTVTDHLSHTTLSHTIFDTWSFTHHFVTPSFTHNLCHTPSFTHNLWPHHLSHTHLCTVTMQNLLIIIARQLTCGAMRSLNFLLNSVLYAHHRHSAELHAPTGILYETIRCPSQVPEQCSC